MQILFNNERVNKVNCGNLPATDKIFSENI